MMKENNFCTASQDGTIKFFDLSYPRRTESVINTEVPVWRACYTVRKKLLSFLFALISSIY